ncbi:VRR-NUC domain-containing protein [Deinococcus budaensis]|uniref:VRR-NUC domain-containing protein n=1 Tax=Deinococcus budaensis TaxID=1665626 RepID=A0A7W8GFL7_9DEIO|nr:hypothetical protein [Deinococcus budaensis]
MAPDICGHPHASALPRGAPLTPFDETFLRKYKRRHPHLFPQDAAPAPADQPGAGLPRSASNGYATEAEFQTAAKSALEGRGWDVQESLKGSHGGGTVWYTPGWPDLAIYLQDGTRRLWFAELKQPGRTPTDEQLACHARLRNAGFRVVVAWTLEGLLAIEEEERTA